MGLTIGTNCGFVTSTPSADPNESNITLDSYAWAMKDTVPTGYTTITEIGWWYNSCSYMPAANTWEACIYSDTLDEADSVVGTIQTGASVATSLSDNWISYTGLNITVSAGSNYWIAVQVDSTPSSAYCNYDHSGGDSHKKNSMTALPSSWGSSDTETSYIMAIYAIVSTGATGTNTQINIGDDWKEIEGMQINIGDVWKDVASAKINIGDAWKTIF